MIHVCYIYFNPSTCIPFYVGAGKEGRQFDHLKLAAYVLSGSKNRETNRHKINTILKILREGNEPLIEVVFRGTSKGAFELEHQLILTYGRRDLGNGPLTNLRDGGEHGGPRQHVSLETRNKMSLSKRGNKNSFYGKTHSDRVKKAISKAQQARTPESRKHTDETRSKMSEIRIGAMNENAKSYWVTRPDGTEELITCMSSWCRDNGVSRNTAVGLVRTGKSPKYGRLAGWAFRPAD